jgi:Ca2+-dependent lipid-binding protein
MSQLEGCDVEVVEARHLIAADKGGTSDPFAQVLLIDADGKEVPKESFKTKTWKKTLTPQWRESFKLGDDTLPSVLVNSFIEVRVFDEDKGFGASNDPLGVVRFPLKLLARKSKLKFDAWFTLEPTPAMQTKGATVEPGSLGEVRLKGRLLGNAPGIFAELKESAQALGEQWPGMKDAKDDAGVDEVHALKFKDFEPNELHVMLTRARDLPIMDTALLVGKGSSDPFVSLSVFGTTTKSTVKKKSLNPDWNESFVIPVDDLTAVLEV